ncbi:type IV pilus modification protein PilV [Variovorax paradoxus]|uniref:type IV pilus modification protein PilV n=1 Tax=Variovorax paradoxus TaxID=34073 RepID=UPI003390DC48
MTPASPSRRSQHGVAMIEVLVAVLILSFGVLGLIGLQARAINVANDAEDRNQAALLADEIIAAMWINRSTTVAAADVTAWDTTVGSRLPNGDGTVTAVPGDATLSGSAADVAITWKQPSRKTTDEGGTLSTRAYLPVVPVP